MAGLGAKHNVGLARLAGADSWVNNNATVRADFCGIDIDRDIDGDGEKIGTLTGDLIVAGAFDLRTL